MKTIGDMMVDGVAHILVTEASGRSYPMRYSRSDLEEFFTAAELDELRSRGVTMAGAARYVDMIAAARAVPLP